MESGYVRVAGTNDIEVGIMKKVTLEDRAVLIINFEGVYYAVDSVYTHFGGDLSEKVDVVTMKTEQTDGLSRSSVCATYPTSKLRLAKSYILKH